MRNRATVLMIVLLSIVFVGCGDQKAKDRANASRAEAEAYRVKQESGALATAVAVSSDNQSLAMQALSTQAAISNQIQATSAAIEFNNAIGASQPASGGVSLFEPFIVLMMIICVCVASASLLLVVMAKGKKNERVIVYYVEDGRLLSVEETQLLTRPAFLRPLEAGKSVRVRMLLDGREGDF